MSRSRVLVHSVLFAALIWPCIVGRAAPLGTAWTYQGRLNDHGTPANGTFDLTFALFDDRSAGSQIGDTVTNASVVISNGVFTTDVDFTDKPFDGTALWLEIGVRSVISVGPFEILTPRQPVTPTPYALRAINANTALSAEAAALATNATTAATATAVPWAGITSRPGGLDDGDNDTLYSNGTGLTLVGTQFSLDTVFTDGLYWKLGGNAGTTAGVNFVGTTDNQALELKANNSRVLRLEPNATSPNVVGGSPVNTAASGKYGVTIGGGGASGYAHQVLANYGTIGGGRGNTIQTNADYTTIGGGRANTIRTNSDSATIAGGYSNDIQADNTYGTIGGGYNNTIGTSTLNATIAGGRANTIGADADSATIAGGYLNEIQANNTYGTIGGGYEHLIGTGAAYSTIAGGRYNTIRTNADSSTIAGGYSNEIQANNTYGTIAGGYNNTIRTGSTSGTIAGGYSNEILTNSSYGTIAGGQNNYIQANNSHAAIGGGTNNVIQSDADFGTISGGGLNVIQANADYATIAGGWSNVIQTANNYGTISGGAGQIIEYNTSGSTIAGGYINIIRYDTDWSTIGGGYANIISTNADSSTIAGGTYNTIFRNNNYSSIGGGYNNVIRSNTYAGTISGGYINLVGTNADYSTIPGGYGAATESYGQMAYANGYFGTTPGSAQVSTYVLRRTTTNAISTELFLDGASQRLKVPTESTWVFEILVVGRGTAANVSCGYRVQGVIENNAGSLVFVPNPGPTMTVLGEDNVNTSVAIAADTANDALDVRVVGIAGVTIRWVAVVRAVQVRY